MSDKDFDTTRIKAAGGIASAPLKHGLAPIGFVERLVAFWSNHFCISAAKSNIARAAAGSFEREAIRPHVTGHFADMLRAVEQHPAMLNFLDNAQSIGPDSKAGLKRNRGLNENCSTSSRAPMPPGATSTTKPATYESATLPRPHR